MTFWRFRPVTNGKQSKSSSSKGSMLRPQQEVRKNKEIIPLPFIWSVSTLKLWQKRKLVENILKRLFYINFSRQNMPKSFWLQLQNSLWYTRVFSFFQCQVGLIFSLSIRDIAIKIKKILYANKLPCWSLFGFKFVEVFFITTQNSWANNWFLLDTVVKCIGRF